MQTQTARIFDLYVVEAGEIQRARVFEFYGKLQVLGADGECFVEGDVSHELLGAGDSAYGI